MTQNSQEPAINIEDLRLKDPFFEEVLINFLKIKFCENSTDPDLAKNWIIPLNEAIKDNCLVLGVVGGKQLFLLRNFDHIKAFQNMRMVLISGYTRITLADFQRMYEIPSRLMARGLEAEVNASFPFTDEPDDINR